MRASLTIKDGKQLIGKQWHIIAVCTILTSNDEETGILMKTIFWNYIRNNKKHHVVYDVVTLTTV